MVTILFPGRHHLLTKFQHQYLFDLIQNGVDGKKVDRIFFAITSANHERTRRNPVPLYLRAMAITKFGQDLPCEIKICPIPDIKDTKRFADYVLNQIYYQTGEHLTPNDTILACSTSSVFTLFKKLGFRNLPVELRDEKKETYATLRPYEVINLLVRAGKKWRNDPAWKKYASEATQRIYAEYGLGDLIIELFKDSLLDENADITDTRDYVTYAAGMDRNIKFKFNDIKPFVVQGKIADAGCGTGALIRELAKEFNESDIIGIEGTRKFYEYCRNQDYGDAFVFFYRRNVVDQNFKPNTINTFIYSSILHEIYSYIGKSALHDLLKNTFKQLAPKGRIIIRDVVGPENPDAIVHLLLNDRDGSATGPIEKLSSYHKFFRFVKDFKPRKIQYKETAIDGKKYIVLRVQDAYEYLSKMNYVDNWLSEMHEEFGFWSFPQWKKELQKIGFAVVEGSKEFKSDYIIEKMYKGKAELYAKKGKQLSLIEYPSTNMILAAEKPY